MATLSGNGGFFFGERLLFYGNKLPAPEKRETKGSFDYRSPMKSFDESPQAFYQQPARSKPVFLSDHADLPDDTGFHTSHESSALKLHAEAEGVSISAKSQGASVIPASQVFQGHIDSLDNIPITRMPTAVRLPSGDAAPVKEVHVEVINSAADPDAPELYVQKAMGLEDHSIQLNIDLVVDTHDNLEAMRIELSGFQDGTTFSAGHLDDETAVWILEHPSQLTGLTMLPPKDYSGAMVLHLEVIVANSLGNPLYSRIDFKVDIEAAADVPGLSVINTSDAPLMDTAVHSPGVDFFIAGPQGEDGALSVVIYIETHSDIGPNGVTVEFNRVPKSASFNQGKEISPGNWLMNYNEIVDLKFYPPKYFSGELTLGINVYTMNGFENSASYESSLSMYVTSLFDVPIIATGDSIGSVADPRGVPIQAFVFDTDEALLITISQIPEEAHLSAGTIRENGAYQVTAQQLATGLRLIGAAIGSHELQIEAQRSKSHGSATTMEKFVVNVLDGSVPDSISALPLSITVDPAAGKQNEPIDLNIEITSRGLEIREMVLVTISGLPEGASLNHGAFDGEKWIITPNLLTNLQMIPPKDFNGALDLTVNVVRSDELGHRVASQYDMPLTIARGSDTPVQVRALDKDKEENTAINDFVSELVIACEGSTGNDNLVFSSDKTRTYQFCNYSTKS